MNTSPSSSDPNGERARAEAALRAVGHAVLSRPGRRDLARRDQWRRVTILGATFQGAYWVLIMTSPNPLAAAMASVVIGLCVAGGLMQVAHPSLHFGLNGPVLAMQVLVPSGLGKTWWRNKHNVVHHRDANHVGRDDDLTVPAIFRVAPGQPGHWFQAFQPVLLPLLLPLLHLGMMWNAIRFAFTGRVGTEQRIVVNAGTTTRLLVAQLGPSTLLFGIGAIAHGVAATSLCFGIVTLTVGAVLASVFVVEHTIPETTFDPDPALGWHVRQLLVAADTATSNALVTWFIGGLNHHVEHHMFPKAAPHELAELRDGIRRVCAEFGLTAIEYPTWRGAWAGHVRHLRALSIQDLPAVLPSVTA